MKVVYAQSNRPHEGSCMRRVNVLMKVCVVYKKYRVVDSGKQIIGTTLLV